MEICCELCAVNHSRCWSKHPRLWLPDVKKSENGKGYRVTIKVAGACGRSIDACDHNDNRDMKPCLRHVLLPCHPAIRSKDKSERSVLLLPLYALLQSFVARSALVPHETGLSVDSLLLCHYKQIVIQPANASFPVLLFRARVHLVHHQLKRHSRSHQERQQDDTQSFSIKLLEKSGEPSNSGSARILEREKDIQIGRSKMEFQNKQISDLPVP